MSWIAQTMLTCSNWYHGVNQIKASLQKDENPLRLGILSAAAINYTAIIDPVSTHPGVIVAAIAARQKSKAQAQIDKYNLGSGCKAYGSYDEVIKDASIDAVYIPLPNGLHAEWAIRALHAGKHVLIEKPISANAEECRQIADVSKQTGKLALEAFHWRFHPAAHHIKSLIESGEYGNVKEVFARLSVMTDSFAEDDIRFQYKLGGGASLDLAYVFSCCCYFAASDISNSHFNVQSAVPRIHKRDNQIDEAIDARFTVEESGKPAVKCHVSGDLNLPKIWGLIPRFLPEMPFAYIELEKARIEFNNFVVPTFTHSIIITEKDGTGNLIRGSKRTEKVYVDGPVWKRRGERWWTTYRYQLEAFVEAVRRRESGRDEEYEGPLVELGESEKMMEAIDLVYDRMGLLRRGL